MLGAGVIAMVVALAAAAHLQAPPGVTVEAVRFQGASGAWMRALLYRPDAATPATPAPAVLAVHGYLNSAEVQSNFAIEFARRGYVVLAPDQRGHGGSDPAAFSDGFGGPDALAFLRRLPYVDRGNIGLEGHSMGGWTVLAAAKAHPDGYRAMVLEGSSVGPPFAPPGDIRFPRNLMVVFGAYDEFGGFMWGPEAPVRTGATRKAMALLGLQEPVVPGRVYGDIEAGTARVLETPQAIHAGLHQSRTAIGFALEWFGRTLKGGRPLAPGDQIWPYKEAATALALVATAPVLIGLFGVLLRVGAFAPLARDAAAPPAPAGSGKRWIRLAAVAAVPVLAYLPVMRLAEQWLGENAVFRQTFSNQIAVWSLFNALLALLTLKLDGAAVFSDVRGFWRSLGLAALVGGGLYGIIAVSDAAGHVDPQFWILSWRPLEPGRWRDFLLYLPAFLFYAVMMLRMLDGLRPLAWGPAWRAFAFTAGILAAPLALFLAVQYGTLLATGALLSPTEGLRVIVAIPMLAAMVLVSTLAVATTRMARDTLPGALLCGVLLTWFITATQAIGGG